MAGILLASTKFPWRRALQVTVNAFCLIVLLSAAQKLVFPNAGFFLETGRVVELKSRFLFHPHAGGPIPITQSFFLHSMVVPEIVTRSDAGPALRMVTQMSLPGTGSMLGPVAVVLWIGLLGLGIWSFVSTRGVQTHLKKVVGLTLLGQLVLHLAYGDETFLYSLHFVPLLLTLSAFTSLSRRRKWGLGTAVALAVFAGIHNHAQFQKAAANMHAHPVSARLVPGVVDPDAVLPDPRDPAASWGVSLHRAEDSLGSLGPGESLQKDPLRLAAETLPLPGIRHEPAESAFPLRGIGWIAQDPVLSVPDHFLDRIQARSHDGLTCGHILEKLERGHPPRRVVSPPPGNGDGCFVGSQENVTGLPVSIEHRRREESVESHVA
jgi:hypothetical protein